MTSTTRTDPTRPSVGEYLAIGAIIATGIVSIIVATSGASPPVDVRELFWPMFAMFAVTAGVWLLMVLFRNAAVLTGIASLRYFRDYSAEGPAEWIERPARTFDNLMQVPTLFYVVLVLMTVVPWVDSAQLTLAWIFVASRAIHAIVSIAFNYVPFRFATYTVGCITLAVMWVRLALEFWAAPTG
jgi:hypothetical protein